MKPEIKKYEVMLAGFIAGRFRLSGEILELPDVAAKYLLLGGKIALVQPKAPAKKGK